MSCPPHPPSARPARSPPGGPNSLAPAFWDSFSSPSATPLRRGGPSPQDLGLPQTPSAVLGRRPVCLSTSQTLWSGSSATFPRPGCLPCLRTRHPQLKSLSDSPRAGTLPHPASRRCPPAKPLSDTRGQDPLRKPHNDAPSTPSHPRPRTLSLPAHERVRRRRERVPGPSARSRLHPLAQH